LASVSQQSPAHAAWVSPASQNPLPQLAPALEPPFEPLFEPVPGGGGGLRGGGSFGCDTRAQHVNASSQDQQPLRTAALRLPLHVGGD
jgi:hypothetical protein